MRHSSGQEQDQGMLAPYASMATDLTNWVVELAKHNREWVALIVLILAFGESLAFVSLIFPFWGIMVFGIGPLLGTFDAVYFWTVVAAAGVGAALGDWLSYWLGYHYHNEIQNMWPLRNHKDLMVRGRIFFKRWGAWAIVIGRFLGPLRASVPIVAGITEMPWFRFQIANWSSAFLWAAVLLAPGKLGIGWLMNYLF
jgi:membrane protein DedA with SNARE-associated domain